MEPTTMTLSLQMVADGSAYVVPVMLGKPGHATILIDTTIIDNNPNDIAVSVIIGGVGDDQPEVCAGTADLLEWVVEMLRRDPDLEIPSGI